MAAFVHKYPHYQKKLRRSIHDAIHNNPKGNEAPFYEVWDLWINDFILHAEDYSSRPQGVLSVALKPDKRRTANPKQAVMKRSPDFIVYHSREAGGGTGEG